MTSSSQDATPPASMNQRKAQFYVLRTALSQINGIAVTSAAGDGRGKTSAPDVAARPAGPPVVVVLVSTRWTRYLKEQMGLKGEPVFEREALACEPDTHPNGHPFAWLYRDPNLAIEDERRLLAGKDELADRSCAALKMAIQSVIQEAASSMPGGTPGIAAVPVAEEDAPEWPVDDMPDEEAERGR